MGGAIIVEKLVGAAGAIDAWRREKAARIGRVFAPYDGAFREPPRMRIASGLARDVEI